MNISYVLVIEHKLAHDMFVLMHVQFEQTYHTFVFPLAHSKGWQGSQTGLQVHVCTLTNICSQASLQTLPTFAVGKHTTNKPLAVPPPLILQ
jgi:hypothetical protein